MIGPKNRPACCRGLIRKRPTGWQQPTDDGFEKRVTIYASTALSTEMAGGIIASPKNSDAQKIPMASALRILPDAGRTSE
jgi:hypothetical protein